MPPFPHPPDDVSYVDRMAYQKLVIDMATVRFLRLIVCSLYLLVCILSLLVLMMIPLFLMHLRTLRRQWAASRARRVADDKSEYTPSHLVAFWEAQTVGVG
jgi:hypothetical protein